MSVYLNRSMDAKEYARLIRRNAYLEDVSDYQRERIDNLEKRIKRVEDGLSETTRVYLDLRDDLQALVHGYRCARCKDTGTILVGSGAPDDPYDEESCPVCDGREEPEFDEDIDLDAPPEEDEP